MTNPEGSDGGPPKQELGDEGTIKDHPLVEKLQPDPDKHQPTVVLTGYQNVIPGSKTIRIYLGLDFQSYFEIPLDDIIYHWASDPNDVNSPTVFSIKDTSTPNLVIPSVPGKDAGFLRGHIVSAFLANSIQQSRTSGGGNDRPPRCQQGSNVVTDHTTGPCEVNAK